MIQVNDYQMKIKQKRGRKAKESEGKQKANV